MRAALFTPWGELVQTEPYRWRVTLTCGIPCDAFELTLPALKGILEVHRVELAGEDGPLCGGWVDRTAVDTARGTAVLTGRGPAAPLLDTEAVPVRLARVGWAALEKRLLAPLGLGSRGGGTLPDRADFAIDAGQSHFGAVSAFIGNARGVFPRFGADGVLDLTPVRAPASPPVLALPGVEMLRRGGRPALVLIRDRDSTRSQTLENPRRKALGLYGRAVMTAVGADGWTATRAAAQSLLDESDLEGHVLAVTLPGDAGLRPADVVSAGGRLWRVDVCTLSDQGETALQLAEFP